jgi:hypothetical protein
MHQQVPPGKQNAGSCLEKQYLLSAIAQVVEEIDSSKSKSKDTLVKLEDTDDVHETILDWTKAEREAFDEFHSKKRNSEGTLEELQSSEFKSETVLEEEGMQEEKTDTSLDGTGNKEEGVTSGNDENPKGISADKIELLKENERLGWTKFDTELRAAHYAKRKNELKNHKKVKKQLKAEYKKLPPGIAKTCLEFHKLSEVTENHDADVEDEEGGEENVIKIPVPPKVFPFHVVSDFVPPPIRPCWEYRREAQLREIQQRKLKQPIETPENRKQNSKIKFINKPRRKETAETCIDIDTLCDSINDLGLNGGDESQQANEVAECDYDLYLIDSGASRHIVNSNRFLREWDNQKVQFLTANGEATSPYAGSLHHTVTTCSGEDTEIVIRNASYLPNASNNIISVGEMLKAGADVSFKHKVLVLPKGEAQTLNGPPNPKLSIPLIEKNGLFFLKLRRSK